MNTDSQWNKKETCFVSATLVWLKVIHNTSFTSGELAQCLKRITWASELGSCQSYLCTSLGFEQFQKSKGSFKDCFENVNKVK